MGRISFLLAVLALVLTAGGTLVLVILLESSQRRRAEAHDLGGIVMAAILTGAAMSAVAVIGGVWALAAGTQRRERVFAAVAIALGLVAGVVGLGCGGGVTIAGLGHFFFF